MTLQRPAGIGICPSRLPEREGYDIQPEKGCPAKIRTDSGLILYSAQKAGVGLSSRNNRHKKGKFIYPNQKRERPAISSNDRGLPYSPPQGGSAICKGQHR